MFHTSLVYAAELQGALWVLSEKGLGPQDHGVRMYRIFVLQTWLVWNYFCVFVGVLNLTGLEFSMYLLNGLICG